jgi:UDPglucose 6-dehydrogenase
MHIAVIGTGYVGLVTGACFAEFGNYVTCVDNDGAKIASLNEGKLPIYEPSLLPLLVKNTSAGRLSFTTDLSDAVKRSLVVFLAVGTPASPDGSADLRQIEEAAIEIAHSLDSYKVIVTKSTVPAGSTRYVKRIIDENKRSPFRFSVAANPEFLREGAAVNDFMRPDRVVIGADDEEAIEILKDLYRPLYLIETPFVTTTPESAEMIKYAANVFLATKISLINEIANLCDLLGADVRDVAKGIGMDKRIGSKFLHAGPGFGGSCFPKDAKAFVALGLSQGYEPKIASAALAVNEAQKASCVDKVKALVPDLSGKTVAVLGLAFKPETDDIREAPSLRLIRDLLAEGVSVRAYDPVAMHLTAQIFPNVRYCADEYEAALGADALVVMTEWNQFRSLDFERLKLDMKALNVVDLRNIYEPARLQQNGFHYVCTGRGRLDPAGKQDVARTLSAVTL